MDWINELAENIQEELDNLGYRVATSEIKKFVIKTRQEMNGNIFVSSKKLAKMYLKQKGGESKCLR
jgi:galactitol-specific phosphotransferase system IIB component